MLWPHASGVLEAAEGSLQGGLRTRLIMDAIYQFCHTSAADRGVYDPFARRLARPQQPAAPRLARAPSDGELSHSPESPKLSEAL
jgi:hypothetical protein